MSNRRIQKKLNSRYLAEFLVDCSQDAEWKEALRTLELEDKLDTAERGFPNSFHRYFPETQKMPLQFCVERLELADVPRAASCWWPSEANEAGTQYYMCYPAQFPQAVIYLAMDFDA